MSLAVVRAPEEMMGKLEFYPHPCGNKECKAPTEWWILNGVVIQSICRTCATMLMPIIEDPYWVTLENEYQQELMNEKRRIDRLKSNE